MGHLNGAAGAAGGAARPVSGGARGLFGGAGTGVRAGSVPAALRPRQPRVRAAARGRARRFAGWWGGRRRLLSRAPRRGGHSPGGSGGCGRERRWWCPAGEGLVPRVRPRGPVPAALPVLGAVVALGHPGSGGWGSPGPLLPTGRGRMSGVVFTSSLAERACPPGAAVRPSAGSRCPGCAPAPCPPALGERAVPGCPWKMKL